jgi:hypothetical protein
MAALALACACDQPPAFPAPQGPPKRVAVVVSLPVYVLGTWTEETSLDALRDQLAKYNVEVVDRSAHPDAVYQVDLGQFTYRTWQEVDVWLRRGDERLPAGRIRVPDLQWTTLQAAAVPEAELIARSVWFGSAQDGSAP